MDGEGGHLFIGDLASKRVEIGLQLAPHCQARFGRGRSDQLQDHCLARQWFATPVDRNGGKEPMFDLIPLARPRRKMANGDYESSLVSQALQFTLP